jgi:hypothetical protein
MPDVKYRDTVGLATALRREPEPHFGQVRWPTCQAVPHIAHS